MNDDSRTNTPRAMIVVGDDLTAGGRWQEWFPEFDVTVVADRGDTTDRLSDHLPEIVERQPGIVVVLTGANDFRAHRTAEHVVRGIETFLAQVRVDVPGVRTLVQSILPEDREHEHDIREANRHLQQYSTTLHAQFLDLWPVLATDSGELDPAYTEDRVTLSGAGYDAWLAELRPAIERLLDAPPMTSPIPVIRSD